MSEWLWAGSGFLCGSFVTWALLFWSIEMRVRNLRRQTEAELEELQECVQRARAGKRMAPENEDAP